MFWGQTKKYIKKTDGPYEQDTDPKNRIKK